MTTSPDEGEEKEGPVIRDKRRIDPETGKVREGAADKPSTPEAPADGGATVSDEEVASLKTQLAERLTDLQRLKAEYDNYRKRVERDRVAVREQALGQVLSELLPVLDDIGRARDHDELTGGFKSVAESLEAVTGKLGLERYGEKGEPFDPVVHEALMHAYSAEVTETSVMDVLQPGYRIGERILRPARVAVAEPDPNADQEEPVEQAEDAAKANKADSTGKADKGDEADSGDDGE
ncbi:nucleotide exchange factor GrpE [Actinomadura sp. KC06]|uniref:nucleotide exchange factor GrpE n=1 Tax=Actinomadura sp. KC06 TaxID=2530369 RepID=UPI00105333DD|nr:nucleotide exchange factor GrpE [Actinomadura sp. KC06]TDD39068.1 nucleotide exchange factor GrpE [Actinomadura sp. KC06]